MRLQVRCINKQDRPNPHERITKIGGDGWKITQAQAIYNIKFGVHEYYVSIAGRPVDVIVSTDRYNNEYIRTVSDGEGQNNLLALPECK